MISSEAYSFRYIPPSNARPIEIQLPPFSKEKAQEYIPISEEGSILDPIEPILGSNSTSTSSSGTEPSDSPIASAPKGPENKGLPGRIPRKPPTVGLPPWPSRPEPPTEQRGGRATEDLEDLLLEGPSPSREAIPIEGIPKLETSKLETSKLETSKLLKLAYLWHQRLGHISLRLLKKTAKIAQGIPNFDSISEAEFQCLACDRAKAVHRLRSKPIDSPKRALDIIEGDTFEIKLPPYNKRPIGLILVDCKTRFRWLFLLRNCHECDRNRASTG